jgi:MFS transporter, ACS family, glucarate transporter
MSEFSLGGAFAPFVVGVVLDRASWSAVYLFLVSTSLIAFTAVATMRELIVRSSR